MCIFHIEAYDQLVRLGVGIVHGAKLGHATWDDESHLRYATQEGRVLVSCDCDFESLHYLYQAHGMEHGGIVYFSMKDKCKDIGLIVNEIQWLHSIADYPEDLYNQFWRVGRWKIMSEALSLNYIERKLGSKKYRIIGKGVTVEFLASLLHDPAWSVERICQNYALTPAEVHAAWAFYYDHQAEIDGHLAEESSLSLADEQDRSEQRARIMARHRARHETDSPSG